MKLSRFRTLLWWAARDLLRRPGRAVLLGGCLCTLSLVAAVPLLLTQALTDTARELLAAGPSLVVRRVNAGGWAPLPAAEAQARARAVVGVTRARARVWGAVAGPGGPVTVVGVGDRETKGDAAAPDHPRPDQGAELTSLIARSPGRGEALVGPGLSALGAGAIQLTGFTSRSFKVVGVLPDSTSMVAHDLVLLQVADARAMLGLEPGAASDLAVDVFHQEEAEAIVGDLSAAFDFPVQISRRSAARSRYALGAWRRGGLVALAGVPALLALALLVVALLQQAGRERREVGLLKALGWGTGEIVAWRMLQATLVGLPATVLGLLTATVLVFLPGVTWPGAWLLAWTGPPPPLTLLPTGATLVVVEVAALVLVPFAAATLIGVVHNATATPDALLDEVRA
jgi:hypothetical protein